MQNNNLKMEIGTLYEVNKQLMKDKKYFKCLTHMELAAIQKQLEQWFQNIEYAMLLCNDIHYYTIFNLKTNYSNSSEKYSFAASECIGCLKDQEGDILSIELQEDNTWEIWIRKDEEPIVFYLFNYKQGVIEC